MEIEQLLSVIRSRPEQVEFSQVIEVIDACYDFTPVSFQNGALANDAGQNAGSCRLFAFAKLHDLTEQQTLHCFGSYYRDDVLQHPQHDDHQNIRQFMSSGWSGISFQKNPLALKRK
jgi:hypothetical protein